MGKSLKRRKIGRENFKKKNNFNGNNKKGIFSGVMENSPIKQENNFKRIPIKKSFFWWGSKFTRMNREVLRAWHEYDSFNKLSKILNTLKMIFNEVINAGGKNTYNLSHPKG